MLQLTAILDASFSMIPSRLASEFFLEISIIIIIIINNVHQQLFEACFEFICCLVLFVASVSIIIIRHIINVQIYAHLLLFC